MSQSTRKMLIELRLVHSFIQSGVDSILGRELYELDHTRMVLEHAADRVLEVIKQISEEQPTQGGAA